MKKESGVHIPLIELVISRFQDIIRLQPKPSRYLVPDRLASRVHSGDELVPTFPAHWQAAEVLPVDPLGVMQHVDHLSEREQRVPVASRGDAPDRAQRVERDEVKRVPARLSPARDRATSRRHAILHLGGEEGRDGALHRFATSEGEHEVVVRELDDGRVLHEHRRRETRRASRFGRRRRRYPRRRRRRLERGRSGSKRRSGRAAGGRVHVRVRGAVLIAGDLEDEARKRFCASRGLRRSVTREIVKGGRKDGSDVELAREVDDVDRGGDLVARVVMAVGRKRHAFAPVPLGERRGEVAL